MPPKMKKSSSKKSGGSDEEVRKFLKDKMNPWIDALTDEIEGIKKAICGLEAVEFRPGTPQAIQATANHYCSSGGTGDTPPPPPPPPKFK